MVKLLNIEVDSMSEEIKFGGTYLCSKCGMHHNSAGCPKDLMMKFTEIKSVGEGNVRPLGFTLTAEEVDNLQSLFKAIKIADKLELIHLGLVFDTFIDYLLNRIKQWQDENKL